MYKVNPMFDKCLSILARTPILYFPKATYNRFGHYELLYWETEVELSNLSVPTILLPKCVGLLCASHLLKCSLKPNISSHRDVFFPSHYYKYPALHHGRDFEILHPTQASVELGCIVCRQFANRSVWCRELGKERRGSGGGGVIPTYTNN